MNLLYFIICTVVGRAVGCACTIFGLSLIPFERFNTIYDWLQFIAMVIVFIFVIIKVSNLLSKKINEMKKPKPLPKQIDLEKLEEHREQVESDNGSN